MQEAVCYNLKNKKIDCIRIDGKTPQKIRQELVNYFQETPTCRVACLSITAAGVGLTLTAASMYVACNIDKLDSCCVVSGVTHSCTTESSSPSSTGIQAYGGIRYAILGAPLTITLWRWVCGSFDVQALLQAEDRAHRIGQRNCITAYYLIANNTLDEVIWYRASREPSSGVHALIRSSFDFPVYTQETDLTQARCRRHDAERRGSRVGSRRNAHQHRECRVALARQGRSVHRPDLGACDEL